MNSNTKDYSCHERHHNRASRSNPIRTTQTISSRVTRRVLDKLSRELGPLQTQ